MFFEKRCVGPDPSCVQQPCLGSHPWSCSSKVEGTQKYDDARALRLSRVRAQPQASISVMRVCIVFHATAYAIFGSSLQAQSRERVANSLTVFAGSITSLSIGVVGNCFIRMLIGFALQPARASSYSALVVPTRGHTSMEPGICGCGQCICGEPSGYGQRMPVKAPLSSSVCVRA